MHRADLRAASEQRALRALEHFYALEIEQLDDRAAGLGDRHAILEHRDARFHVARAIVGGDAANHEARVVWALQLDVEPRHERRERIELLNALLGEEVRGERGHSHRHILYRLAALLRGDRDLLERGGRTLEREVAAHRLTGDHRELHAVGKQTDRARHDPVRAGRQLADLIASGDVRGGPGISAAHRDRGSLDGAIPVCGGDGAGNRATGLRRQHGRQREGECGQRKRSAGARPRRLHDDHQILSC